MKHILVKLALGLLLSASAAFAHSDAFKAEFVDTLVSPYLAMQTSLAGDDLEATHTAAKHFLQAMTHAPHEGEAHKTAAALATPTKTIAEASDLKAARNAFLELSNEMILLVKHVGIPQDTELFVAHCPMAFGNKGADWMQSDKTVANPYYGSMMLRCGSIETQINGEQMERMKHKEESESKQERHEHSIMQKPASSMPHAELDAIHAGIAAYKKADTTSTSLNMSCCGK